MRIAICDDQRVYREDILEHCKRALVEESVIYRCFASGEELLRAGASFDFLFLDIEMAGMDGIQVKELLGAQNTQTKIIFLTSHKERVLEAFGANVISFLTKPVQEEAFWQVIEKMKLYSCRKTVEWEDNGKLYAVDIEDIKYIEAQDKYTYVAARAEKYLVRRSIREWEELLPKDAFGKVNRSYLVSLSLFDRSKGRVMLEEGKSVPISRFYQKEIEEKYKQYIRNQMERMG